MMFIAILPRSFVCIMVLSAVLAFANSFLVWPLFAEQDSVQELRQQLDDAREKNDFKKAVEVLDLWIKQDPDRADLYYLRGCDNFFAGNFRASVNDFDQLVKLSPSREQSLWERGVSQYFAGDYAAGAKQFADYQNYHDQDVENSAFRYLCVAKSEGVQKARETLLPIENDPRPGLMEVFELYKGNATPMEILMKMENSKLDGQAAAGYRFYTLLYVGLYHDAHGETEQAAKFLGKAADPRLLESGQRRVSRYMWDTARLAHQEMLRKIKQQPK